MIKINICTMFKDSEKWHEYNISQVETFFYNLKKQERLNIFEIEKVICAFSNSADNTYEILNEEKNKKEFDIKIINISPLYNGVDIPVQSTANKGRLMISSECGDSVLEESSKYDIDYTFWIESDILFSHDEFLIIKMIKDFSFVDNLGCVAPLVFFETGRWCFYDTYVYKNIDNTSWSKNHGKGGWTKDFNKYLKYIPMKTIGTCCLIRHSIIKNGGRFNNNNFFGLCDFIISKGYSIIINKDLIVYHPSRIGNIKNRII